MSDEAWDEFCEHMRWCGQCFDLTGPMCIEGAILLRATETPDGQTAPPQGVVDQLQAMRAGGPTDGKEP